MKPKILRTPEEHSAALAKVESLMDAPPGSQMEEDLELWGMLVEKYEDEHFPIEPPDPIDAILFRMDQQGLKPVDLQKYVGGKGRVSEVLNHKRPLSLAMIRALSAGLKIPTEVLVQESQAPYGRDRSVRKKPGERASGSLKARPAMAVDKPRRSRRG
jgi:HTH-type transcriptional regulator / antitoxin HigA